MRVSRENVTLGANLARVLTRVLMRTRYVFFVLLFSSFLFIAWLAGTPVAQSNVFPTNNNAEQVGTKPVITQSYAKLPLAFEINQGQVKDLGKLVAHGVGSEIYLAGGEIILRVGNRATGRERTLSLASKMVRSGALSQKRRATSGKPIRVKFVGSNPSKMSGLDELPGTVNYFIGKNPDNWHTNVKTYSKIKYEDVYPGIDQIFYGSSDHLEYDFVVSPGANPRAVKFRFSGQLDLSIDASGDLVVHTAGTQELRLHKPIAYQEINGARRAIPAQYVIKRNNQIGFEIGSYDQTRQLVIDPILSYSSYLGGAGDDAGFDIAVDGSGSAYVTGTTDSGEFSPLNGTNAFVAKFSPDGTQRMYLAIIGGAGDDTGFSIAIDGGGAAYVTGDTDSTDFPVANSFQPTFGGGLQDSFIAKLNPTGSSLDYSTYFGGSGNDTGFAVAADFTGSAYLTGSTDSSELSTLGNTDAFVMKLSPSGTARAYFSILGGSGNDSAFDIAVDDIGNAFVAGSTDSANFTILNAFQPNYGGSQDAFVAKLEPSGAVAYSTYLGGSGTDCGYGIAVDSAGNAYITGSTDSLEFTTLGGRDVFVTKFNATGSERTYLTILGGSGDDAGFSIAVDSSRNAYLTGSTNSSNFTTANAIQLNLGGSQDVFVARVNTSGSALDYSTYLGLEGNQSGFGIALDAAGSTYITGFTSSTNFPIASSYQSVSGGRADAFVLKISTSSGTLTPTPTPTPTSSPTPIPSGSPTIFVEEGTTNRAVAIDSVTWVRGPFRILNNFNFSADHHTRVMLFTSDLGMSQPNSSQLTVRAGGVNLTIESVGPVLGVSGMNASYIVVRLPDGLPTGDLPLTITLRGLASINSPTLSISP